MPSVRYDRSIYLVPGALVLAGLWLVVSPWVVGVAASPSSRLNAIVTGILIALLAAGNIWGAARSRVLSWVVVLLGAWTIIGPFAFGEPASSAWTWSSVITGVIVAALGVVEAMTWPAVVHEPEWPAVPLGLFRRGFPSPLLDWEDYPLWMLRHGLDRADDQGGFRGVGPRDWQRPDKDIRDDVCGLMADHGRLDAKDIEVTVANGEVTLQGDVDSRASRRLAERIAESVRGVRDVINRVRVRDRPGDIRRVA
jgi:BON domain/SPW repeat